MTFRAEIFMTHPEMSEPRELETILKSFLTQFYAPTYLHIKALLDDSPLPPVESADLATDLSMLEEGVETSLNEVMLNEPKPGPPQPGGLTFAEYYTAFANVTFRALTALYQDPKNWMHTWHGGWTQIDGHFRSPNMVVPEKFGLVVILGESSLKEAQRRLGDSTNLEVVH